MNTDPLPQEMIDDARSLYLKYGGRQHLRIESEMRAKGWRFYRQLLYTVRGRYGVTQGLPDRFGWRLLLLAGKHRSSRKAGEEKKFELWLSENFPELTWYWDHQRHVYKALARVTSGECKRLMIFMPPRHGKSEMVTVRYTAWRRLQDPKLNVILGSYSQRLSDRFSRKIKRIVQSAGDESENHPPATAVPSFVRAVIYLPQ